MYGQGILGGFLPNPSSARTAYPLWGLLKKEVRYQIISWIEWDGASHFVSRVMLNFD